MTASAKSFEQSLAPTLDGWLNVFSASLFSLSLPPSLSHYRLTRAHSVLFAAELTVFANLLEEPQPAPDQDAKESSEQCTTDRQAKAAKSKKAVKREEEEEEEEEEGDKPSRKRRGSKSKTPPSRGSKGKIS
jgi:hypothetical protein